MKSMKVEVFMKKTLLMGILMLSAGLSGCDQKINQQVVIDKSLLETLSGRTGSDSKSPNATPTSPQPSSQSTPRPVDVPLNVPLSDESAIRQIIQDNANALNSQDVGAFSNSLHPQSQIMNFMPDIFNVLVQYQTRYRINEIEITSKSESSASAYVYRSTTDISGTIEQDIIYTLRKSGDAWKVFFMEVDQSDGF